VRTPESSRRRIHSSATARQVNAPPGKQPPGELKVQRACLGPSSRLPNGCRCTAALSTTSRTVSTGAHPQRGYTQRAPNGSAIRRENAYKGCRVPAAIWPFQSHLLGQLQRLLRDCLARGTCTQGLRITNGEHAMPTNLLSSPRGALGSLTNTQGVPHYRPPYCLRPNQACMSSLFYKKWRIQ
jgi:hypothetical protein